MGGPTRFGRRLDIGLKRRCVGRLESLVSQAPSSLDLEIKQARQGLARWWLSARRTHFLQALACCLVVPFHLFIGQLDRRRAVFLNLCSGEPCIGEAGDNTLSPVDSLGVEIAKFVVLGGILPCGFYARAACNNKDEDEQ